MKRLAIVLAISVLLPRAQNSLYKNTGSPAGDSTLEVPVAGNTYAQGAKREMRFITDAGIDDWTRDDTRFDTYFRVSKPGTIKLALHAKTQGESKLQVSINQRSQIVTISGSEFKSCLIGEWKVTDTGYIKISLSGMSKTGTEFADVSGYQISGSATEGKNSYVRSNEGNFYYWGRRGPSVHLNYPFPDDIKARWFYNEVTVAEGQDVIGSYFMSIGFGEGYFGIQVNSASERRILFSVWSPYKTDDPKSIPENMRIAMLKKGTDVYTGEFGNEGSGGQSYLRYNWKGGNTYRFLLKGDPDVANNTTYTAYFFDPESSKWLLIASFKRPGTNTSLKRFHSFLENFNPDQGDKERKVLFGNQWVCDNGGNWTELTTAVFTYDNTAAKGYRMDYAGGLDSDKFFLKNCGFFAAYTPYRSSFSRPAKKVKPFVDLNGLP